jgi:hypothetical protein
LLRGDASRRGNGFYSGDMSSQSSTFAQQNDFKQFLESMWSLVKMFAKNPIDSIVNTAKTDNFKVGLFFVGVQALIASLTAIILVKRLTSSITGFLFGSMSLFGSRSINIPYFAIFIRTIFAVAVQYFLLVGLFYLGSKFIAKKTGSKNTDSYFRYFNDTHDSIITGIFSNRTDYPGTYILYIGFWYCKQYCVKLHIVKRII